MKYLKYLKYLILHKYYVGIECFKKGLYVQGILHDWSKFRPSEFVPYAKYFYGNIASLREINDSELSLLIKISGVDYKEKIDVEFNYAWLMHQHRNKHHWQHWILREDSGKTIPLEIPDKYIIEMICDWIGAGKATNNGIGDINDTITWYENNKSNMLLNKTTKRKVESMLNRWEKK